MSDRESRRDQFTDTQQLISYCFQFHDAEKTSLASVERIAKYDPSTLQYSQKSYETFSVNGSYSSERFFDEKVIGWQIYFNNNEKKLRMMRYQNAEGQAFGQCHADYAEHIETRKSILMAFYQNIKSGESVEPDGLFDEGYNTKLVVKNFDAICPV